MSTIRIDDFQGYDQEYTRHSWNPVTRQLDPVRIKIDWKDPDTRIAWTVLKAFGDYRDDIWGGMGEMIVGFCFHELTEDESLLAHGLSRYIREMSTSKKGEKRLIRKVMKARGCGCEDDDRNCWTGSHADRVMEQTRELLGHTAPSLAGLDSAEQRELEFSTACDAVRSHVHRGPDNMILEFLE